MEIERSEIILRCLGGTKTRAKFSCGGDCCIYNGQNLGIIDMREHLRGFHGRDDYENLMGLAMKNGAAKFTDNREEGDPRDF